MRLLFSRRARRGAGLQMAPMVDVVFLLLIFFLVSTHVRPKEADFLSNLYDHGREAERPLERVRVYLEARNPQGTEVVLRVGNRELSEFAQLDALLSRLDPERTAVVIDGDSNVRLSLVACALDSAFGAGMRKVTFARRASDG